MVYTLVKKSNGELSTRRGCFKTSEEAERSLVEGGHGKVFEVKEFDVEWENCEDVGQEFRIMPEIK